MSYYLISNFRSGLDSRRLSESAVTGSVRQLTGGFVNAGGEIEKLRGFVEDTDLTATLEALEGNAGWAGPFRTGDGGFSILGTGTFPPFAPAGISGVPLSYFTPLGVPGGATLTGHTSSDTFGSDVYLVAQFSDRVRHYYGEPQFSFPPPGISEVLDGTASLSEKYVLTIASKMWRAGWYWLRYSDVNDPTAVQVSAGGGYIDVTTAEGAIGLIRGLGFFRNRLAVFGQAGIQIWTVDEDPSPSKTYLSEVIGGHTLVAPKSISTYDNGDVLFLSKSGIRSLRTQNLSSEAATDDIGTPINDLVQEARLTGRVTTEGISRLVGQDLSGYSAPHENNIASVVEPDTGQYWLAIGRTVFILSRSRSMDVQAWATAELPANVRGMAAAGGRLLICTEDSKAYLYGGPNGMEYTTEPLTVVTPFMSAEQPATEKTFFGVDVIAAGRWTIEVAFDPSRPDAFEHVATVESTTTCLHQIPLRGRSTHISFRLRSTDNTTIAKLSQLAVHFNPGRKS